MKTKLLSLALFLLVSFSMQAQPPSFSGVYAGSISSSSVTISCNVNGNNSLTTGYFAIFKQGDKDMVGRVSQVMLLLQRIATQS